MKRKMGILLLVTMAVVVQAQTVNVIFSSDGISNAMVQPQCGMLMVSNRLYGYGTVAENIFSINSDGSDFQVLHSLDFWTEGGTPRGNLALIGNKLYGSAYAGGADGEGTIFSINTDGTGFAVLRQLSVADGTHPQTGLVSYKNKLYGIAGYDGGNGPGYYGAGTVFSIDTNGAFAVLKCFHLNSDGSAPDGIEPLCFPVITNDVIYGTAYVGGAYTNSGAIYSLDTSGGNFTVLHSFDVLRGPEPSTNHDGGWPTGGLLLAGNTLYGTTSEGGANGYGTVFAIDLNGGNFRVLFNFCRTNQNILVADGEIQPNGSLALLGDTLYGVTQFGGTNWDGGTGTIYSLKTNGADFCTVHSFVDDTSQPLGSWLVVGQTLYGVATGQYYDYRGTGDGAIFAVQPLVTLTPNQTNYRFKAGWTYYVSNSVALSGTTTIEGGAIIKYKAGASMAVEDLDCETTSNNPAIFTARDDDTVGVILSDSTHSPSGYYGDSGLEIDTDSDASVHDIQVRCASWGLNFIFTGDGNGGNSGVNYSAWNVGISNCYGGIEFGYDNGENSLSITNVAMANIAYGGIATGYMLTGTADNCTFTNIAGMCNDPDGYGFNLFYFTDCKFDDSALSSYEVDVDGDSNGFHNCGDFSIDASVWPGETISGSDYFGSDWYYY